jgi:hypothetical protein
VFNACSPIIVRLTAVAGLVLSASACVVSIDSATYSTREERSFAVTGRPDIELSTYDGSIAIRSWDRPAVVVEIERRAGDKAEADAIKVKAEQTGNRIVVDVAKPDKVESAFGFRSGGGNGFFGRMGSTARLTVSVPRECDLVARSGDGSITIARVAGRVDLNTEDGSISASDIAHVLKVHTGDGSIRLDDITGVVDIETEDGGVGLTGKLTAVRLRTADGSVTVRAEPGSTATAAWEIRTGDGGIHIDLPDGFGANLDANTADGTVRLDGLTLTTTGEVTKRSLRGTLGSGGEALKLRSGSGSITVRRF